MRKKLISTLMILCMVICAPLGVFAGQANSVDVQNYTDPNLGITLERTIADDGTVTVVSTEGQTKHTVVNDHGTFTLDGEVLSNSLVNSLPLNSSSLDNVTINSATVITWGSWQPIQTIYIQTGGLTTAVIATIIAAKVPWAPVSVALAVAAVVAGKYDELMITGKIRYGHDVTMTYYERTTSFYGDGKLVYGPITDKGSEPL